MKIYSKPECDELVLVEEGVLCQSGGTEDFIYNETDPRNNYGW